jgi:hypothetical protein
LASMNSMTNQLQLHAKVLFELDGANCITRINEPDPETDAPLVFLALGRESKLVLFRTDVPDHVVNECEQALAGLPFWTAGKSTPEVFEPLREVIHRWRTNIEESHGTAFGFTGNLPSPDAVRVTQENSSVLDANFPHTRSVLDDRSPVWAVVKDGVAVAACYSARHSQLAAEAGVATVEGHRGQGFAPAVVSAWAIEVTELGLLPLYSTDWSNAASLSVAQKPGLEQYADTVSFSLLP